MISPVEEFERPPGFVDHLNSSSLEDNLSLSSSKNNEGAAEKKKESSEESISAPPVENVQNSNSELKDVKRSRKEVDEEKENIKGRKIFKKGPPSGEKQDKEDKEEKNQEQN